ncbi:MAG: hypothetical protein QW524_02780 [Candidatus Woesearchaeota archaeon]
MTEKIGENFTYHIIGLVLRNRHVNAFKLQEILSKYGHLIKTRLGIHETRFEQDHGLIILHAEGDPKQLDLLMKELNSIKGITAKIMTLP